MSFHIHSFYSHLHFTQRDAVLLSLEYTIACCAKHYSPTVMASYISSLGIIVLLTASATLTSAQSGSGTTTRYWDCCKPSCAWAENSNSGVVNVCDVNDQPLSDPKADSGCKGGPAYMCSSQAPWAVSEDLAYGFTAVSGANPACCQCFQLTFKGGPIQGKKMIVQATNTGGDVGAAQFDLAV